LLFNSDSFLSDEAKGQETHIQS